MQWGASTLSTEKTPSFAQLRHASGEFSIGSHVEYFSTSQNTWISAHVVKHHADGSYDLDCKPAVPSERIRSVSQSHVPPTQIPHQPWKAEDSTSSIRAPVQFVCTSRQNNSWHFKVSEDALRFLENHNDLRDQHSACAALLTELHQDIHTRFQQVRNELPMPQDKLCRVFENEKQRAKEQWSMRAIGPEAVHHEYYKELSSAIADEEAALARCNEMMAELQRNEAANKLRRPSKEVAVVEQKHCACNAMPMLGFRRFLQSHSASQKTSKPQAS